MTTPLPYENLTWIQNGEPVSGGTGGNSDGVLNRPLVQIHSNVDKVRDTLDDLITEVTTARGGEASLDARLDGIDTEIANLDRNLISNGQIEILASDLRARVPSGYDYASFQPLHAGLTSTHSATRVDDSLWYFGPKATGSFLSENTNKVYTYGNPKPIYVDGYKINIDTRPGYALSNIIDFGAAPSTGTRLDYAFLEVWKEKVVIGAADDVLFPNGAVFCDTSAETFDGCTLYSADASGGNNPLYLASSSGHGKYVKANDANINTFLANPNNNVVLGSDGNYYQIRYRIRKVNGIASANVIFPYNDTTNIKAQGKLASPSSISFSSVTGDVGLSKATDASLSEDSVVRAIPLCMVHRRNSTAWSLINYNGAGAFGGTSGRPDGKFHDQIHFDDILDLRHHVMVDNNFNLKSIYDCTLAKVFDCSLATSFETVMSDTDGNEIYKDLNIYGTKVLHADGVAGTYAFDASWEVKWKKKAENGIPALFDGIRNYFSDVGGDQAVFGYVPDISADGVSPTSCWTYVASTKTLTFDATDLNSGGGTDANRTKVSTQKPKLVWDCEFNVPTHFGHHTFVAGTWSDLGTDSASFTISSSTKVLLRVDNNSTVSVGDVYQTPGGVNLTYVMQAPDGNINWCTWEFSSTSPLDLSGVLTKISGTGPATLQPSAIQMFVHASTSLSGLRKGAVYTAPNLDSYIIEDIRGSWMAVITSDSVFKAYPPNGIWTKTSGDGPATFTSDLSSSRAIGYSHSLSGPVTPFLGIGSNMVPTDAGIHATGYVTFTPGSGILSRIPFFSADAIKATHFNLLVSGSPVQQLPNNGVGFIPFGTSVDPLNDGNGPGTDSHTRQTGMVGFVRKDPVVSMSSVYNSWHSNTPCVIKDGSLYKMWFTGYPNPDMVSPAYNRILYTTSTDGIAWSTPVVARDRGSEPNGYDSAEVVGPCVIKDGSTYKMWYHGDNSVTTRILYTTSSDGITWATSQLAIDINCDPNGQTSGVVQPSVIKDGTTYKMWFVGYTPVGSWRIFYSTSSDGITWATPIIVVEAGTSLYNEHHSYFPRVIKDGSIYKMWFIGILNDVYRVLYCYSTDGINWSDTQLFMDVNVLPNNLGKDQILGFNVIKDDKTYKAWFGSVTYGNVCNIFHAVLSMTDSANTGSSLTGVYATEGTLNFAPPADSQVVIFYEAPADQQIRTVDKTGNLDNLHYANDFFYRTVYGTSKYLSGNAALTNSRDIVTYIIPHYYGFKPYMIDPNLTVGMGSNKYLPSDEYWTGTISDYFSSTRFELGPKRNSWIMGLDYGSVSNYSTTVAPMDDVNAKSAGVSVWDVTGVVYPFNEMAEVTGLTQYSMRFHLLSLAKTAIFVLAHGDATISFNGSALSKVMWPLGRPILK